MARWYAMSTQFLTDPKIERLGEKHGPAAVSITVALFSQAMLQEKGGTAERTFRTLANESFTTREVVEAVVADADSCGLLSVEEQDDMGVTVRFPAWSRHQAAGRQAKSRKAKKPTDKANVTGSHAQSQKVTHSTRQDKTRDDTTVETTKSGKPSGFDSWLSHYHSVTGKTSVTGSKPARDAFKARTKEGRSLEDLKAATVGCHGDEFCRTNGHDVPETILRASKVERYIALAAQPQSTGSQGMDNARRRADVIKARQEARA